MDCQAKVPPRAMTAARLTAPTDAAKLDGYRKQFADAINDDLNIPLAMGVLWTAVKEPASKDIYALALDFDKVFGLSLDKAKPEEIAPAEDVPDEIRELAERRAAAKKAKNYAEADALRAEINSRGYSVTDTKDGYSLAKNA